MLILPHWRICQSSVSNAGWLFVLALAEKVLDGFLSYGIFASPFLYPAPSSK